MAITTVDKVKINKYLKEHALDEICYLDLCDAIGKREKINDIEFLEYFTETIINDFRNSNKLSIKHTTKLITTVEAFLTWVNESNLEIGEETLDKIRSFGDFYQEYLDRTQLDKNIDFYDNYIDALLKKVDELYPNKESSESITKYISKISELEEKVAKLNRELSSLEKMNNKLQLSCEQKSNMTESLNKELNDLSNEIRNKSKEICELNSDITGLNGKIEQLQNELNCTKEENTVLNSYKEKYEALLVEVIELRKVIEEDSKEKQHAQVIEVKNRQIEDLIYEKLLLERTSLDELLKFVQKEGLVSNKSEIYNLLQNIKRIVSVDDSCFSICPNYKIVPPKVVEDGIFSINVLKGCKSIDLMLVADFHIKEFSSKVLTGFDMLNEYCVDNRINLILNLGDFYHGLCGRNLEYENAIKNYKIVEQSISLIPRVEGLYHAILGGNHDLNIVQYGFDPLEVLSNNREDIINLGYIHSTIELNGVTRKMGEFDIHHPNTFDLPINIDDDITKMNSYLDNIYNCSGRNRNDSYIDIFGHIHINRFNYPEAYYYIAPFKNGACHLKINFNKNNEIENMVFMPLSVTNKFVKNNEIVYKKILHK